MCVVYCLQFQVMSVLSSFVQKALFSCSVENPRWLFLLHHQHEIEAILHRKGAFPVRPSNCWHPSFFHTTEKASSDLVIPGDGGRWEPAGRRLLDRVSLGLTRAEDIKHPTSPLGSMLLMHRMLMQPKENITPLTVISTRSLFSCLLVLWLLFSEIHYDCPLCPTAPADYR